MVLKLRKSPASPDPECPVARCMALIGGAWTPSIIWSLSGGARRFGELKADLKRISAKVLATRLRELESKRLVVREMRVGPPSSVEYALTPHGRDLVPAIQAIADVGTRLKFSASMHTPPRRILRKRA
jgi:DNA-binding HxlR family transcriptional regulator